MMTAEEICIMRIRKVLATPYAASADKVDWIQKAINYYDEDKNEEKENNHG